MALTLRICIALALGSSATAFLAPRRPAAAASKRSLRVATLTAPESDVEATNRKGERVWKRSRAASTDTSVRDGVVSHPAYESCLVSEYLMYACFPFYRASYSAFDNVVMKTYGRYPITMVSGKGATLTDSTGKARKAGSALTQNEFICHVHIEGAVLRADLFEAKLFAAHTGVVFLACPSPPHLLRRYAFPD